jgi:hypothetical protein
MLTHSREKYFVPHEFDRLCRHLSEVFHGFAEQDLNARVYCISYDDWRIHWCWLSKGTN